MTQPRFFSRGARIALTLFVAVLAIAGVLLFGSVMIWDDGDAVVTAELTNHVERQRLMRLPGGAFVGVPGVEGTVRLRCRNGATAELGYVTRHAHTWIDLSDHRVCRTPAVH